MDFILFYFFMDFILCIYLYYFLPGTKPKAMKPNNPRPKFYALIIHYSITTWHNCLQFPLVFGTYHWIRIPTNTANQMLLSCPLEILLQKAPDSGEINLLQNGMGILPTPTTRHRWNSLLQNSMGILPTPTNRHRGVSQARKRRRNWKPELGGFVVVY